MPTAKTASQIKSRYVLLALALVALAMYSNGLRSPFVWDDDTAIVTNQSIHDLGDSLAPPLETPVAGRPIVNFSLALNYAFGDLEPTGYRVFNLAVVVSSALLLFAVVRRTLRRHDVLGRQVPVDSVALIAATLWMVHPLLSETVDYATQRTESMMGLFFLLTLYGSIRAHESARSTKWRALTVLACAAGMATKESMVVAPVAVVLYDLVFEFDSPAEAWRARKGLYGALTATWVELAFIMWRWPRSTVGGTAITPLTYLLNQAEMITRYLWLSVWPRSLVLDYGVPQPRHIRDVIPQLTLVAALLAATVVALIRRPAAGFLGAMFFLTLAPTSSVIPIWSEVGAERRMYLPLAALVVLVVASAARAVALASTRERARRTFWNGAAITASIVIIAFAIRTFERNRDYQTSLSLWQTVVDRRPQGRARFALATELMDAGRDDDALAQLRLAVVDFPDARAGLGTELLLHGHVEEAIQVLEDFVAANPTLSNRAPARSLLAQGHRALAERALGQQKPALAAEEATKSLNLDPANADGHNVLGAALASQGNLAAAIPEFQAAVRINPRHQSAVNNLARATAIMNARGYASSSGTPKTSK